MLPNEISTQVQLKECTSFRGVDELNLLLLCFDKKVIFSAFSSKCYFFMKLTNIQMLFKKIKHEARIKCVCF